MPRKSDPLFLPRKAAAVDQRLGLVAMRKMRDHLVHVGSSAPSKIISSITSPHPRDVRPLWTPGRVPRPAADSRRSGQIGADPSSPGPCDRAAACRRWNDRADQHARQCRFSRAGGAPIASDSPGSSSKEIQLRITSSSVAAHAKCAPRSGDPRAWGAAAAPS